MQQVTYEGRTEKRLFTFRFAYDDREVALRPDNRPLTSDNGLGLGERLIERHLVLTQVLEGHLTQPLLLGLAVLFVR